jgi:phage FluMu protein Com
MPMKKVLSFLVLSTFIFSCNPADEKEKSEKSSPVKAEDSLMSEIKCPHCGFISNEKMPTEVCLIKYTCKGCEKDLYPKDGDCCVFCSYGDHKCPSMQE